MLAGYAAPMNSQPSASDLARYQATYARRRRRQFAGFAVVIGIALLGILADVTGFGHIRVFVILGIIAMFVHGFSVGFYWRCPRCHTAFIGASRTHCEACGVELDPRASPPAV